MPDLQNFSVTPLASASVNVPRARIECQVCDSRTGAVLRDFTGANAVTFPNILSSLTGAERLELLDLIATWLILKRFGA